MKKSYSAPTLTTFGPVEALTQGSILIPDCSRVQVSWDEDHVV